jgi:hypothetical protein
MCNCNSALGDIFVSDEQKKLNESLLKDAELQRQQNQQLLDYMQSRKTMVSYNPQSDNNNTLIIAGALFSVVTIALIIKFVK